jgi:hypothetical protein
MVHTDGTGRHTHSVSNFKSSNGATVTLDRNGSTFIFGTSDVSAGGAPKWNNVNTLIILDHLNVFTISFESSQTDNHFLGQPIYGVVESLKDQTGKDLIASKAAAPSPAAEANATTTTITKTPTNATTTTTTPANHTGGNQSGGFLGTLNKLFGGGKK